jgi:hypothetical protein
MEHNVGRELDEPLPPVTTGGNHMLVQVARGTKSAGENRTRARSSGRCRPSPATASSASSSSAASTGRVRPGDEPAHTVTAAGQPPRPARLQRHPGFVRDVDEPAGVVTTRDKQSLLVPYYRTGVARSSTEPMGAVTARTASARDHRGRHRRVPVPDAAVAGAAARADDARAALTAALRADRAAPRQARPELVELSNELRVKMIGNAVSAPVATMLGTPSRRR